MQNLTNEIVAITTKDRIIMKLSEDISQIICPCCLNMIDIDENMENICSICTREINITDSLEGNYDY